MKVKAKQDHIQFSTCKTNQLNGDIKLDLLLTIQTTLDLNIYTGKDGNDQGDYGVSYGVVMKMVTVFSLQEYHPYNDHFYTIQKVLDDLYQYRIYTTSRIKKVFLQM